MPKVLRGGPVRKSAANPTSRTTVGNSFKNNYQAHSGVLGANINLEAEFLNFVNANRVFMATFSQKAGISTNQTSADSFNVTSIKATTHSLAKEAWKTIVNSQNAYFDGISALADAGDDPEAQNAIAHATISAHLAIDLGGEIAEAIGDTKEIASQGAELDTAKDLLNNTAGRDIAIEVSKNGGSVEDIPEAVSKAYRNGELWIIRSGKIVPSNTPKVN